MNLNFARRGVKLVMQKAVSRAVIFIDTGVSSCRACNIMTFLFLPKVKVNVKAGGLRRSLTSKFAPS